MIGAGVVAIIVLISSTICFFGTKELEGYKDPTINFFSSCKIILTFRPYLLLMGAFLQVSLAIQVSFLLFRQNVS